MSAFPYTVRSRRQDGTPREISPHRDPAEAEAVAALLRDAGDGFAHTEVVSADVLERALSADPDNDRTT